MITKGRAGRGVCVLKSRCRCASASGTVPCAHHCTCVVSQPPTVSTSCQCLHPSFLSHLDALARDGVEVAAMEPRVSPTAGEEATWLASTAARLTAIRRELAESSGMPIPKSQPRPPPALAEGSAHGSVAPFIEGGVVPRGQPVHRQEELAALRLGRSSPISFAVTRHAMMIAGRPVVVPREKKNRPSPFLTRR